MSAADTAAEVPEGTPAETAPEAGPRGPRRRTVVLAGLVVAGAVAASTRTVWATASAPDITGAVQSHAVTGADASPAVLALALVALAAAAATSLSSRWVRWVTGPVQVLAGAGTIVAAAGMLADPTAASAGAVAEATGISGVELHATASAWPWAAIVGGVLMILVGLTVLAVGGRWPRGSRYTRASIAPRRAVDPGEDPAAAWDALTRGEDPTDPEDAEDVGEPGASEEPAAPEDADAERRDEPRHSRGESAPAGPVEPEDPPAGVAQ